MIVLLCILLISCTPVITPIPIPVPNECVLSGVWSGYVITTDNFLFTTNVGMKGINVPVLLILHESKWYVWNNGYRDYIKSVTTIGGTP